MLDITRLVRDVVSATAVLEGVATVFVVGSTAAVTTIEYEPGLTHDLPAALERIAPRDGAYRHEQTWNDDNGHSHIRASLIGPSLTIPVVDGKLPLGTWQQIVLLEFDTRARERQVVVQVI
jgi:secondary thiamine-phosphate synthase enzyme